MLVSCTLWLIEINDIFYNSTLHAFFMPVHVNFLSVSVCDSLSLYGHVTDRQTTRINSHELSLIIIHFNKNY